MTNDPLTAIRTRQTPQREQADPRQVVNNAGGFVFEISPEDRIRRFLILGSAASFYQGVQELTKENAAEILAWAEHSPERLVEIIKEISIEGRAPKQNATIFALAAAAASKNEAGRKAAFDAMPEVLRIGTHFAMFAKYLKQFRGLGGTGLKKAARRWYEVKRPDALAYQLVKYRSREGFTQRDLLRLFHPKTDNEQRNALYKWVTQGTVSENLPRIVHGYLKAQEATTVDTWAGLVTDFGLSWEMLPDEALKERKVWEALVDQGLPMTALIRQLPRLTRLEVVASGLKKGNRTAAIVEQLGNQEYLTKGRVHPFNVLVAQRTYASGQSFRGQTSWAPVRQIADALDKAFYLSFGNVRPANKRTLIGLDVSGSMGASYMSDSPVTPREASAAMALITVATEPEVAVYGFSTTFRELSISPRQRLDDVIRSVSNLPFAGTDCALPMVEALRQGLEVDTFSTLTDNETWYGGIHPHQALKKYRDKTGIPARNVVWGMTATKFSIADPNDPGSMDLAGLDSAAPQLLADFSAGRI